MSHFSIRVMDKNSKPAKDIGVTIFYHGLLGGHDEKRTNSEGWVQFKNYENKSGEIWVHGHNMGSHSLADGKTYSFNI